MHAAEVSVIFFCNNTLAALGIVGEQKSTKKVVRATSGVACGKATV